MTEPKNCPFCGSKLWKQSWLGGIICLGCKVRVFWWDLNNKQMKAAWNKRVRDAK